MVTQSATAPVTPLTPWVDTTVATKPAAPEPAIPEDQPLLAPVTPTTSWAWVHDLSQTPPYRASSSDIVMINNIRRTATIQSGTGMIKPLSAEQLESCLQGRHPSGFCYRAYDLTGLSTPKDLAMLTGTGQQRHDEVVFALRWRATDPADYHIPFSVPVDELPTYSGLVTIPPHSRVGPAVLGTGFAPSSRHLVPEFVTADFADLTPPAGSTLVAFTDSGTEVLLYRYLPGQDAWIRMFGPQWRHLITVNSGIPPDQEYVHAVKPHIGRSRQYVEWRGSTCTVTRADRDWVRLRVCRPDTFSGPTLGAHCVERGVYEVWAPASDITVSRPPHPCLA